MNNHIIQHEIPDIFINFHLLKDAEWCISVLQIYDCTADTVLTFGYDTQILLNKSTISEGVAAADMEDSFSLSVYFSVSVSVSFSVFVSGFLGFSKTEWVFWISELSEWVLGMPPFLPAFALF